MGKVIGPIDAATWYTMRMLRESVRFMSEKDPKKWDLAIKKEKQAFNELLQENVRAAA